MAISRNIPADRGLTRRMLMTGFFIVLLYGAFIAILFALLHSLVLILVIAFGLLFLQYWFSAKIAMYAMHAKEVTPEQAPELHGVVDRLCALADMPKPKVAIATTDIPNAFATGRSPKSAVVCVTTGLLRRLDEPEVEAVLSHEISHVAHRDVAVMTIASGLGIIAGLLTRVMFYSEIFGGGRNNNQGGSQVALIEMIILLVSVVVYFISFLLTMALSRYRELAADRSGAILIGRPSLLASALVKITGEMGRIPTKDLRAAEPFNAFFFTPAVSSGSQGQGGGSGFSFGNLFRTHPTLERRLAQLEQLEHQLGQAGSGTTV
jgi:heat shock protein HtpX